MCGLRRANRFPIARFGVMIRSSDDQSRIWHSVQYERERFHQRLESLVSPPVSNGQDAFIRIAAPREIGRRRNGCKGSVRAKKHVLRGVLSHQRTVIMREQNGYGICSKQGPSRQFRAESKKPLTFYSGCCKVDVFNNVVQCNVRVKARRARERGRAKSRKRRARPFWSSETGKDEIVPNHIRLQLSDRVKKAHRSGKAAELSASDDVETW